MTAPSARKHAYSAGASCCAQQALIEQYAPLVSKIAWHLLARLPANVQIEDLMQAGMMGLLEAQKNFDDSKGASFETFAGIRIRGAMLDDVRKGDWVPRSVHRGSRRISEAIRKVEAKTGSEAKDCEIAAELDISISEYYAMLSASRGSRLLSLEELLQDSEAPGFAAESELPASPLSQLENERFEQALAAAIDELPEREKLVLSLYYDEGLNLKEIGQVLSVSESRVCQLHSQCAARLRARLSDWQEANQGSVKKRSRRRPQ
ncbi:RNA polymerase sigma factor FliA [Ventosimonas gracilis]|uniref:RNA polymerase sigma factor FliA n=1 Tax=Ventosimonas gracilis TaxID=1680762 RepID=A0A139SHE6_9GAMM|nr:RNA polymerase sigma factor FliA [Ventosimonas gracilis]KXU33963.1 RNA polymerase sigma factor FliA [Ventosimonas gracilis]